MEYYFLLTFKDKYMLDARYLALVSLRISIISWELKSILIPPTLSGDPTKGRGDKTKEDPSLFIISTFPSFFALSNTAAQFWRASV